MFEAQFAAPIAAGGWSHASAVAVHSAYECAVVLRDLISPHLLRRLKRDVNAQLPTKTEQVLFCRLAPRQRDLYARYLRGREVADVLAGRAAGFRAITVLRKICNSPALLEDGELDDAGEGGGGFGFGGGGGGGGGGAPALSEAELACVERLCAMGFERARVVEAFVACDRNEQLAANYLLEH
jgi:hypothetical protein